MLNALNRATIMPTWLGAFRQIWGRNKGGLTGAPQRNPLSMKRLHQNGSRVDNGKILVCEFGSTGG
jgi:hypothetical protein